MNDDGGLAELLTADPVLLAHADRVELLVALDRLAETVARRRHAVLVALADTDRSEQEWVREEVACAVAVPPATAAGLLHDARDLADLLPATRAALDAGSLTVRQAGYLLERARCLPGPARTLVELAVLPQATGRTLAEWRRIVRRAIAECDPRRAGDRHADAVLERRVALRPAEDGMNELWALLPADSAARLMATLTAMARADGDPADERTLDQRRADALIGLADQRGASARPVSAGPAVHLLVPYSTVLGLDDRPGELAGHGPVPAVLARRIAADPTGTWRRILTDPAGRPVDAGRTYRPPAALRALIVARDATCRFPGCSRPARLAQIDHVLDWQHGGATEPDNLQALCSRHHHLKHEAPGWQVARDPDTGVTSWRSPTGRTYDTPPGERPSRPDTPDPPEGRDVA